MSDRIENLILHGSIAEAQTEILALLRRSRPERKLLARLAGQARRAYLPERALSLLHRVVRPTGVRCQEPATDYEKSEYAAALVYVGACREALKLLAEVDRDAWPNAHLYEAFACSRLWDFEKAALAYERAAAHPGMKPGARLGARVELACAWLDAGTQFERAEALLAELLVETSPEKFRTVHKDAYLVFAQAHLHARRFEQARACLDRLAELNRQDSDPVFDLLIRKWSAIVEQDADALREAQTGLFLARRFEDARSCEYQFALRANDRAALARLYFGSPYPALRARILKALGDDLPAHYDWIPSRESFVEPRVVNLRDEFKEGDIQQRLLRSLVVDFYRPAQIAELHERLYPGEFFNPASSPARIHQAMRRLRRWIGQAKLPLEIREDGGFYYLEATGPVALRVGDVTESFLRSVPAHHARVIERITKLEEAFPGRGFTVTEVASLFGVSTRSALRYLVAARELGLVAGASKGASYTTTLSVRIQARSA